MSQQVGGEAAAGPDWELGKQIAVGARFRRIQDLRLNLQLVGRRLSAAPVDDDLVGNFLTICESKSCAFHRADVNEDIRSAGVRLDEAEALLRVEPLYDAGARRMCYQRRNFSAGRALQKVFELL